MRMIMMMRNKALFVLIAALLLFGLACSDKPKAKAPAAAPKPAAAAPAAVDQAPQLSETKVEKEVYSYEVRNRRDPFKSLIVDIKEKPLRKKKANPVENFDVDEIKLIAILWDKTQHYAMITLPDGKSYTVKKGAALGLYGGRVEDITAHQVKITEQVKNYKGQMVTKDTILKLRQEGE